MKWQYWLWCPLLFCLLVSQHQADKMTLHEQIQKGISLAQANPNSQAAVHQFDSMIRVVRPVLDKNDTLLAILYHKLGVHYYSKLEDYDKAIEVYEKALAIRLAVFGEAHFMTAKTSNNIAQAYLNKRIYSQALIYFERAAHLKVATKADTSLYANILYGMSEVYLSLGDHPKAIEYGYLAMSYFVEKNNEYAPNVPSCLNILGIAHRHEQQYEAAISRWEESIQLYTRLMDFDDLGVANCYLNIGVMHRDLQQYEASLSWLQKAERIYIKYGRDTSRLANVYIERARTYHAFGNLEVALKEAQYSLKLRQSKFAYAQGKHPVLMEGYAEIGHILQDMKSTTAALEAYDAAIAASGTTETPANLLELITGKAKLLRSAARTEPEWVSVRLLYKQADSLIQLARTVAQSDGSQLSLSEQARSMYEDAISLDYQYYKQSNDTKYIDEALYFSEQSKATLLLQTLQDRRAKNFAGVPETILAQENDLKAVRNYWQKEIAKEANENTKAKYQVELGKATVALEGFSKELSQKYPEYHRLKFQPATPLTGAQIQKAVDSETAFIEYFVGDTVLYSVVVAQNFHQFYAQPLPKDFDSTILMLKRATGDEHFVKQKQSIQDFTQSSFALYELLLSEPLKDLKDNHLNIKRLRLVKDGLLGYISFETLLTQPSNTNQGKNVPYLLQDYAVSELYSNTLLTHLEKSNYTDGFGGFAISYPSIADNASATRGVMNPLRFSKKEVRAIYELFGGDTFMDQDATKRAFITEAPNYGILHLTMHGILNMNNPLESALVFAPDATSRDSTAHLLTVAELYATPLKAGLAVLSACNTGNGALKRGEGIMSLARAFAYSGCQTTVMSLWSIPDESSSKIMLGFYRYLKQGQPKDYALQQAKKDFINAQEMPSSTIPNAWAATVVIGDVRPLMENKNWMKWTLGGCAAGLLFAFYKQKLRFNTL
jgi:CHAT domain-containing protein